MGLNRPADVKAVVAKAAAAGLDSPNFHAALLQIAYVEIQGTPPPLHGCRYR